MKLKKFNLINLKQLKHIQYNDFNMNESTDDYEPSIDKLRLGNFIEKAIGYSTMDNKAKSEIAAKFVDETSTDVFELKVKEYKLAANIDKYAQKDDF
ncbi:unnamed protein product [Adineta steineri]|uniref:Uncharacterized protein n=1 Tax=Adineta steineri TaxID=433720 RepID=A0A816D8S8_9BILA|nr:unnamed protein product [Adineta steineri]CAF1631325.1 unnamed protein product [Adineta steineri]